MYSKNKTDKLNLSNSKIKVEIFDPPPTHTQWLIWPNFARKSKKVSGFIKNVLKVAQMVGGYCVFEIFQKSHFNPQLEGTKVRVFWLKIGLKIEKC